MIPSSPDKELPEIPTEDTMARLSAPANETPKTERKSKGIRSLFKHRASFSASSSPATLTEPPAIDGSSPLPSPTVRSGFQQVGLLPSERSYSSLFHRGKQDESGRQSSVSTAAKEEEPSPKSSRMPRNKNGGLTHVDNENVQDFKSRLQSLNDVLSKYPTEKEAHEAAVAEVAAADICQAISSDTDKRSSLAFGSSHKFAEAMSGKPSRESNSHISIEAITEKSQSSRNTFGLSGVQNLSLGSIYVSHSDTGSNEEYRDSLSPEEYDTEFPASRRRPHPIKTSGDHTPKGVPYPYPLTTPRAPEHDTTLIDIEEDESGHRRSYASNIFDDDSSLSQGIRLYLGSKIAEALAEHDRNTYGRIQNAAGPPVQIIVNFHLEGIAKASETSGLKRDAAQSDISTRDNTIGPLAITNRRVSQDLQQGVVGLYAILLLGAALLGPKTLVLTLWKIAISLGVYTVAVLHLGWTENVERDVLIAPAFLAKTVAHDLGERVLVQLRGAAVSVAVEALQCVFKGAEVRAERQ